MYNNLSRFKAILISMSFFTGTALAAEIAVYPQGPLNPRVPTVAPVAAASPAHVLDVDADFTYALTPLLHFPTSGELTLLIRDHQQRAEKKILILRDGQNTLTLQITAAAKGRICQVVITDQDKKTSEVTLTRPLPNQWSHVQMKWDAAHLQVIQDGRTAGTLQLTQPFAPQQFTIRPWHASDVSIRGDGALKLNWASDYAARVEPGSAGQGLSARLFGFDTYVVSQNPDKRDYPLIQVMNAGPNPASEVVHFTLTSEISGQNQSWDQPISIPGRAQVLTPVHFPFALTSDVYHLTASGNLLSERRHFMYVQRRKDQPGPAKFGLHDSAVKVFGFWPDALPISFAHAYANWATIQGPPWTKDFNGQWGIDPALPPDQWNWNPRIDWLIGEGHPLYLCLLSQPFLDWQRGKAYPESEMQKYAWGLRGGTPDDVKYRRFLREIMTRYRGKVWAYEIENEPNTHRGFHADDYVAIAKDVYEEAKSIDPQARVFGICGTGSFIDWMKETFKTGAANYMDGVSWHTYVTPATPEEANLADMLGEVRKVMQQSSRPLTIFNSETGTYVAPRENVDTPIPDDRLAQLIADGVKPLVVPKGWPSRAMSERAGSISLITNAVTNFLAGAEGFVFFGWNPDWPKDRQWWNIPFDDSNFAMLAVSKNGEHTPSRFTLAAGVLTAQLEPADHRQCKPIHDYQIRGAVFPKTGGGEVAVIWSTLGTQTLQLVSDQPQLEVVSLFGQSAIAKGVAESGRYTYTLDVGEEPIYVHQPSSSLMVRPSMIQSIAATPSASGQTHLSLTLHNQTSQPWDQSIALDADNRWTTQQARQSIHLKPGQQTQINFDLAIKPGATRGRQIATLRSQFPDGKDLRVSAAVPIVPTINIVKVPSVISLTALRTLQSPSAPLMLNQPEQVVVGRPPALASLQDKGYWAGPDELSAQVKLASNGDELVIYTQVRDAHAHLPAKWPGVSGSCVEIFLDFRTPGQGFGASHYGPGVYQLVIRPMLRNGDAAEVWQVTSSKMSGLKVEAAPLKDGRYEVTLHIPWRDVGMSPSESRPFGIDVGVNGAGEDTPRKSQMMLFGTDANNRDASRFGLGFLSK